MKLYTVGYDGTCKNVAPFAGAWIEITEKDTEKDTEKVAPFAGAWIEILCRPIYFLSFAVAPFAGAWIEIIISHGIQNGNKRRSLRGSVD